MKPCPVTWSVALLVLSALALPASTAPAAEAAGCAAAHPDSLQQGARPAEGGDSECGSQPAEVDGVADLRPHDMNSEVDPGDPCDGYG